MNTTDEPDPRPPSDQPTPLHDAVQPPAPPPTHTTPGTPGTGPGQPHYAQVVYAQPPGDPRDRRRSRWFAPLRLGGILGLLAIAFIAGGYITMFAVFRHTGPVVSVYQHGNRDYTIAVVPVEGLIDDAQASFVTTTLRDIAVDDAISAVILRVNSPGGYVAPSDQIANAVRKLRQAGKPVVASYGGIAASGGYYCSVLADEIYAEPTTLTGSIGVIGQAFVFEGLLEKIGVDPIVLVAEGSPKKRLANQSYQAWTDEDREQYQIMLDWYYDAFLAVVQDGRGKQFDSEQAVRDVCNGLAYPAQTAMELGLIDALGYLDDAITGLSKRMGVPPADRPHVIRIGRRSGFSLPFFASHDSTGRDADTDVLELRDILSARADPQQIRSFMLELARPRAMYMMP
ncbi:MAG: signal peptide peptidase SppA [Phycisphaerales bacterium]|nr:signal peptide peptidase SppA [Phycisphaerales bacterium]